MRALLNKILLLYLFIPALSFSQVAEQGAVVPKAKHIPTSPLFQISAGMAYSSIDLSRYTNSVAYRGFHGRLVTHLKGLLFLSLEYSKFRNHDSPSAWKDIDTRKFDINAHVSFATNNNLTRIFALAGANNHQWQATRTGFTNQSQLGQGIPEGEIVQVNRWGVNAGCGFTQVLYENIGIFGDYRFCMSRVQSFEKVRILDVMTTFGVTYNIPHTERKKGMGIGSKIYKWTKKGA